MVPFRCRQLRLQLVVGAQAAQAQTDEQDDSRREQRQRTWLRHGNGDEAVGGDVDRVAAGGAVILQQELQVMRARGEISDVDVVFAQGDAASGACAVEVDAVVHAELRDDVGRAESSTFEVSA